MIADKRIFLQNEIIFNKRFVFSIPICTFASKYKNEKNESSHCRGQRRRRTGVPADAGRTEFPDRRIVAVRLGPQRGERVQL